MDKGKRVVDLDLEIPLITEIHPHTSVNIHQDVAPPRTKIATTSSTQKKEPLSRQPFMQQSVITEHIRNLILLTYGVLLIFAFATVAALPLLVGSLFITRVVQFVRSGDGYEKATQLKRLVRICLIANMIYIMLELGIFYAIGRVSGRNDVMFMGVAIRDWIKIVCTIFGLYILSHFVMVLLIDTLLSDGVPLDHNQSGIRDVEAVSEVINSLSNLLIEYVVLEIVPSFKQHKIIGMYTHGLIQVSFFMVIGCNCITLSTPRVVWVLKSLVRRCVDPAVNAKSHQFLIAEKLLRPKYVVYFADGIKSSINFILCSLLLLVTWVSYFVSHLKSTPEAISVSKLGTVTCLTLLICSFLWLVKTCCVLSWEANVVYKRLDSQILEAGKQLFFLGIIGRRRCDILKLRYDGPRDDGARRMQQYHGVPFFDSFGLIRTFFHNMITKILSCLRNGATVLDLLTLMAILDIRYFSRGDDAEDEQVGTEEETPFFVKKISSRGKERARKYLLRPQTSNPTLYHIQQMTRYFSAVEKVLSEENYVSDLVDAVNSDGSSRDLNIKDTLKQLIVPKRITNGPREPAVQNSGRDSSSITPESSDSVVEEMNKDEQTSSGLVKLIEGDAGVRFPWISWIFNFVADCPLMLFRGLLVIPRFFCYKRIQVNKDECATGQDAGESSAAAEGEAPDSIEEAPTLDEEDWNYFQGLLNDDNPSAEISSQTLRKWVKRAHNSCLFLATTLSSAKEAANCLNRIISGLLIGTTFIMWLLVTGLATTEVLVLFASPLLAATFIFGDTCRTIFQGIIFIYVVHPFDVGDLCLIGDRLMVVKIIGIWKTTFSSVDNNGFREEVTYPNSDLGQMSISNYKTKFNWDDRVEFDVGSLDSAEVHELRNAIKSHLEQRVDEAMPSSLRVGVSLKEKNVQIIVHFKYKIENIKDWTYYECLQEKDERRAAFYLYLKGIVSNHTQNRNQNPPAADDIVLIT